VVVKPKNPLTNRPIQVDSRILKKICKTYTYDEENNKFIPLVKKKKKHLK